MTVTTYIHSNFRCIFSSNAASASSCHAMADVFFISDITHPRKWEDRRRWKSNQYSYWFSVNWLFRRENYRERIFNVSFTPTRYGYMKMNRGIYAHNHVFTVYCTYIRIYLKLRKYTIIKSLETLSVKTKYISCRYLFYSFNNH